MKKSALLSQLFLVFLLTLSVAVNAQFRVTGTVTDADSGESLIGVNILVKGTSTGTVTDYDGKYEMDLTSENQILVFSYTGYSSVEVAVGKGQVIDVSLSSGQVLEEVIVIGYGTVKRKDATGSLQSVSSSDFNRGNITGPQALLAGKVAGVTISSEGSPGGGATIRIRGESSLSASNDPLIVIDGVPLDNGDVSGGRNALNIINPNDIESITVLKDASASAIYGNRASGGVILITTKKGEVGSRLMVGYNGYVSFGKATKLMPVLSSEEFIDAIETKYNETHPARALLGDTSTFWQDQVYQTAISHDHNLNISGALGSLPFRISGGYSDVSGILKTDKFNRYTGSVNITPGFFDNLLQVNLHAKAMINNNDFANRDAIWTSVAFDPTQAVYDPESPYGGYFTWTQSSTGYPNPLAPSNPVALLNMKEDNSEVRRYITNATIDYRFHFLPDLRANLNLGYDYSNGSGTIVIPTNAPFAFNATTGGGVNNWYDQTKENSLLEYYMNYKKDFDIHSVDIMGGYSWQHFYVNNSYKNSDAAGTVVNTTSDTIPSEYYLLSLFGRLNYSFNDKYLLTMTLRRDGTSRFAPENRWGLFPAVALAVKLIENDRPYFNNLKIRLGWGITGQQDIGDYYAYLARYELSLSNALYQFGDHFIYTLRPNGYDSNIKWEETTTYNAGFDVSLVKDRLSASLDYYQRYTKDLLNYIPVPAGTNLTNFITTNVGDMENNGVELSLNATPYKTNNNAWDIALNFAYNSSRITKLTKVDDPEDYDGVATGGISGGVGSNIQIHSVGYAPASFYVYKQLYDEEGNILEGQFADLNEDGIVNAEDKYRYEKPAPDYTIGFTSNLQIGAINLSFAGRSYIGNYVYNNVETDAGYLDRLYGTTNYLSNIHRSGYDNNLTSQSKLTFSDHFVYRADFLKIDHITLSYDLRKLLGFGLNVYATVQNPLVVTKYEGIDPEISNGIDNNIYPRPRTFVFGLNANF